MSMNGISNTFIPNTLSGLEAFNATNITINGVDISSLFVPFVNSPSDVDLSNKNLTTSGRIQTAILKLPSVTYGATRVLQVDVNKEVQSIELNGVYVTYTGSTANLDMGTFAVKSSYVPIANEDMINKRYADITLLTQSDAASTYLSQANAAVIYVPYNGASANLNLGSFRAYTTAVPSASNELVNKQYTDGTFPTFGYVSSTYLSQSNAALIYLTQSNAASTYLAITTAATTYVPYSGASGTVDVGTNALRTIYTPIAPNDVINKQYSDTTLLSQAAAGTTYLTQANAALIYLTQTNAGLTYATITNLNLKANIASPTFTGIPAAPTAAPGTNTTQLATTAFVTAAVGGAGVSSFSAGSTGFTPNTATSGAITLAGTLNVANGGTGVTTSTGSGSNVLSASPTLTGTPLAPTATAGTNTTQIATTAFVTTAVSAVGIPTQINATATNTGTLYPVFLTSTAGGASTTYVESDGSMNYDPANNILNLPRLTATTQIQSPIYSNGSGQTVSINASGGLIAGNQVRIQMQGTDYYYFDQNAFYLTQPVNNVISSILNDLYLQWPSGKLLSFNNWANFDNTGLYMASSRKIQAQNFETQPSQNLTLNVPTGSNSCNVVINSSSILSITTSSMIFNILSGFYSFRVNGNVRFAVTDVVCQSLKPHLFSAGAWMPTDGSTSFYITDTQPDSASTTYGRYFGVGGTIYQDFYNKFQWRVYSGISPLSGLADIMKLTTTGLTISKSSISHTTLANYELVLGDNVTTSNYSAKMLIRGTSANAAQCPSIDFTGWYSHTTIQGSIALYDDGNYGGIFAFIVKPNNSTASGAAQSVMEIRATGANVGRLTFPTTYYVDIVVTGQLVGGFAHSGTDVPLKIITGYSIGGSYWYYAGGATWTTTSSQNMSILAYGTISANAGFTLASDIRIKKDIQPAEQGALKVIDSIPIKSYDLIDNYRDGGRTSFNIVAQELIEVFPEAISKGVSYIPSIYSKCQWIIVNAYEIEIHINKPHDLVVGDEIEILLEDSSLKECDVTAIINETTFRVKKWDDFKMEITDECFIYGKKVKDFLRIDKTKVSMLALAGTKELHQIVKLQQAKIEEQSLAINTLTESMKFLTEHLSKLTNAFNDIVKEK